MTIHMKPWNIFTVSDPNGLQKEMYGTS